MKNEVKKKDNGKGNKNKGRQCALVREKDKFEWEREVRIE